MYSLPAPVMRGTWEAKGSKQPHGDAVRKAVCGFANARGGVLLLGAERDARGNWSFPGFAWQTDEPGTWLSSIISTGLSPAPRVGIEVFDRGEGRKAAER
jgi:predicted HTH transcriptional regulator